MDVQILGSEERGIKGFALYTVYIILVRYLNKEFRCYKRYSTLYNLNLKLKAERSDLKIMYMPPREWLLSRVTQTIEFRR